MVKPTGWHTVRYDDLVDGKYLYNRCHLIGYQLTGENANTKNLITGTRYLNIDGMLPFENMVADYVKETGNHVMYRVTPIFEGDNLLANGVLMEGYGCFVNSSREIVSYIDESMGILPQDEAEKYLNLLKKTLSGKLGKNLIDIIFSTEQVADSDEHRLLMALRDSQLNDGDIREEFYQKIINSLDLGDSNYLILLAHDSYDVPRKNKNDEMDADASDAVFSYVVCCVCPVKERKVELGFFPGDNEFHSCAGQIVAAPELGFLFPAFDDRAANIYNALFYSRKTDEIHQEVIDSVFHTTAPMSAAEQKEAFQNALSEALGDACNMELVQSIHDRLRDQIEQHKESHDPEPLELSVSDAAAILRDNGVEEEKILAFRDSCATQFGDGATLNPANLIDSSRFEVKTADATISVGPEHSYLVETRIIDGRKYLLIPADEDIEVNGFGVRVKGE